MFLSACNPNFNAASHTVSSLLQICEDKSFDTTRVESEGIITVTVSCKKSK